MDELTKRIASLSPAKQAILREKLKHRGLKDQNSEILPRSSRNPSPLSFSQQRIWFLDRLEGTSTEYHIAEVFRLRGTLNPDALEHAVNQIVARHEILRTRFIEAETGPVQIVEPSLRVAVPVADLSVFKGDELEDAIATALRRELDDPFDLSRGPLLRVKLLLLGEEEHIFVWTCHHLVCDGWSQGIFYGELAAFYEAFRAGRPLTLPELTVQYADYALWQRNLLQGEELERQLIYWRKQLANTPLLELPADRPRPPRQSHAGARHVFVLSGGVAASLKVFNQRENLTPFMSLLAAFQVLLSRYSGQVDFLVGTPMANRQRIELESQIGFFVNTVVLRADVSGNAGFREVAARVRRGALDAYQRQDLPFEKLVEELNPPRDLSRHPLFQVIFALQNTPSSPLNLAGVEASPLPAPACRTRFELELHLLGEGESWTGTFSYNTDLFDAQTIARMAGHYQTLLEGLLAEPELPVSVAPMLTKAERQQMLAEWNDTTTDFTRSKCVHQLFEEQAARTPDRTALVHQGGRMTYRELDEKANQLAHCLLRTQPVPHPLVGIYLDASFDLLIAILGVLKAGGAYMPIDIAYPRDRIVFMLEDSKASVLVTSSTLAANLPPLDTKIHCVDQTAGLEQFVDPLPPCVNVCSDNIAYVIYTSGSTGNPKGVLVSHGNVTRLFAATECWFEFNQDDVWTLFHSCAFDFSVWEMWGALLYGGKLVIVPYLVSRSPGAFYQLLSLEQVTVLNQTPAAFRQLIQAEGTGEPKTLALRLIIFGGEALEMQILKPWFDRRGDKKPRLVNMFGITETTVHVTYRPLTRDDLNSGSVVGKPIPDLQVYILSGDRQLVPVGVPGELYVGGAGVARGYLNRPELTAERFIANPFSNKPGARLYKSGDVGRYLPNGDIEFLGRIDHQVKIRGFRVELGEIETALGRHPRVRQAVVSAREDEPGDKRLVAYVVADEKPDSLEPAELRDFLRQRLPHYMVPAAFMMMGQMPLTPNGKINHKALPPPALSLGQSRRGSVAPRNPVEEVLAGIWSEVMMVGSVGIHDNFFDLGGHSLLATRVATRIRGVLLIEMPLRTLFEHPTIAELARELSLLQGPSFLVPPLLPAARDLPLPLSFAQQRLWFLDRLEGASTEYHISEAWHLQGKLDRDALVRAVNGIVARHECLRSRFVEGETGPVQAIAPELRLGMLTEDLRALEAFPREAAVAAALRGEMDNPFDLGEGPLLRIKLLVLGENEHIFLLTCHHIIADGWSQQIFCRELAGFYSAFREAKDRGLPELPVQYGDYTVWQRQWLRGDELERQLQYWRKQLAGAPILELPGDRPRPPRPTYTGARCVFVLSREQAARLKVFNRAENTTPYMTLLAAFQGPLSRYTGRPDFLVGTPIANRQRIELENLIGFFVNTLPLRADLTGDPGFRALAGRVRRTALDAYQHQDLPFEKMVEEINPPRDLSRHPLFQVMFALQNAPTFPLELADLKVSPHQFPAFRTHFDLELDMRADGDTWAGTFSYNKDLFDEITISRMAGHFQTLLEGLLAEPDRPVSTTPMLTAAERHQILVEWNDTAADYPREKCVHRLIEEQVRKTPDSVAVVFGNQRLTYRELDTRANGLARHLRGLGVETGSLVGIIVERSLEMVVGLLGVLKAGGAYVPMDPVLPRGRLQFMIEEARPLVLLTLQKLAVALPPHQARVVCLDALPLDDGGGMDETSAAFPPAAADLAYVLYTSGSTGQPKGVRISHRAIVNFLTSMCKEPGINAGDRLLAVTTLSFDIAGLELYLPLVAGARVFIARGEEVSDGERLAKLMLETETTVMQATPATWRMLLQSGWQGNPRLKILCGGEALSAGLADDLLSRCGELWNLYGPTETTIWSALTRLRKGDPVSIGRPIRNTRCYVLDAGMQPLPAGVPGELLIGGDGLASGYLARPELTAQKFIANPFCAVPGERLYRTGDFCRFLPDGNLQFLGRMDLQIKIRGFRVELGEIEAALALHEGVAQAVVNTLDDSPGEKRLAAFIVPTDLSMPPGAAELRDFLKPKLPLYMLPAAFVVLEKFPLTPNGKLDRKALTLPELTRAQTGSGYVAPRSPLEEALASLWAGVLRINQVGIHDNFFDLGGHSLLALRFQRELEARLGAKVSLAAFFQNPTVAGLGELLSVTGKLDPASRVLKVQSGGDNTPLFCLHFLSSAQTLGRHLGHDRDIYAVESPFDEEIRQWHEHRRITISLEELGARYVTIIKRLQPRGPYQLAGFCFAGVLAFEVAGQLRRQRERVDSLTLMDAFYEPGCKPHNMGWIKRWVYHAGQFSKLGPGYLAMKLQKKIKLEQRRRSQLKQMRAVGDERAETEIESLRLPQAEFLLRLLKPYRGTPYDGNALLLRTVCGPDSFYFDTGTANGWDKVILGDLDTHEIQCDHSNITAEPHIIEVAKKMRAYMSRLETNPKPAGGGRLRHPPGLLLSSWDRRHFYLFPVHVRSHPSPRHPPGNNNYFLTLQPKQANCLRS